MGVGVCATTRLSLAGRLDPSQLSNLHIHLPHVAEPTREEVRMAVEIVCDYLNDAWSKKLMEHCGLTEVGCAVCCGFGGSH